MTRSKRLAPVRDVVSEAERAAARRLAQAAQAVSDQRSRLQELERYEREYREGLRARVAAGIGAAGLRDYHAFLGRLGEAVGQQRAALERAHEACESSRESWLQLTRRRRAVTRVIEQAQAVERRALERREQSELDERAQRAFGDARLRAGTDTAAD